MKKAVDNGGSCGSCGGGGSNGQGSGVGVENFKVAGVT